MTAGNKETRFAKGSVALWKFDVLKALLTDGRLLASDFRVAVALLQHLNVGTGRIFPSQATIAALTHMGERNAIKCLERLRVAGWVTWTRGNSQRSNEYRFDEQTIAAQLARMKTEEAERRRRRSAAPSVNHSSPSNDAQPGTTVQPAIRPTVHPNKNTEEVDAPHRGKSNDQAA